MKHILLSRGASGNALNISLHVIFIVYLIFAGQKFDITKRTDISVDICLVPLFGSIVSGLDRTLTYMYNICMD